MMRRVWVRQIGANGYELVDSPGRATRFNQNDTQQILRAMTVHEADYDWSWTKTIGAPDRFVVEGTVRRKKAP